MSAVEPLHDLKGHIKNLWELIPQHLPQELKQCFKEELNLAMGNKDQYRGSDYRLSAILIYQRLRGKCPLEFEELLFTLVEITRLSYQKANLRSPRSILRLYNVTFLHSARCEQIFGPTPKLTKFYGVYYHATITHLPETSRVIAPSSLYTESEERIFGAVRAICLAASQRGVDSVRDVGIIRLLILIIIMNSFFITKIYIMMKK